MPGRLIDPLLRRIVEFGLDVLLDPTTLLGQPVAPRYRLAGCGRIPFLDRL
jgi:hypothetical protein